MTETNTTPAEAPTLPLPSLASLVRSTVIAGFIAVVLLVFVVLPSEYNIDPTGVGGALGLTRLAPGTADYEPEPPEGGIVHPEREDTVTVEVPAGKGIEYKFTLNKGERMKYAWKAASGTLFFDFHGEPAGVPGDVFESFVISTSDEMKGTFTAPFDGVHGWYWKNRGEQPVKVELTTSGNYKVEGLK